MVLPKPDLVGQQRPAFEMPQHLAHRLLLIHVGVDALERRQAEQVLEVLRQPQFDPLPAQKIIGQIAHLRKAGHGRRKELHAGMRRLGRRAPYPAGRGGFCSASGGLGGAGAADVFGGGGSRTNLQSESAESRSCCHLDKRVALVAPRNSRMAATAFSGCPILL